jgi:predicted DCC family thiol-disulfide oxidoreductase YuxK
MGYLVIYDGNCNLCVNGVKLLEGLDQGQQFRYCPMQDKRQLAAYGIPPQDCEAGMILLDLEQPQQRWQGSAAAEAIAELLPAGAGLMQAYRAVPGLQWMGDRLYTQVRDRRYQLFGQYPSLYESQYPLDSAQDLRTREPGVKDLGAEQQSVCPSCSPAGVDISTLPNPNEQGLKLF